MQTLKSLQSIHSNAYGFIVALVLHSPFVFLALDFDIIPSKTKTLQMETTGALEFSLASFVPAEPIETVQKVVEPEPKVIQPLPKTYEKREKKVKIKKENLEKPIKKVEKKEIQKKIESKPQQTPMQDIPKMAATDANMQSAEPIKLGGGNYQSPFLVEVKRLIDQYNSYPRAARRMGLTGTVIIRLVLEESGQVKELKVLESSTHAILDNQTLKTIEKASKFFPKPDKAYILDIPIEYQLKRG